LVGLLAGNKRSLMTILLASFFLLQGLVLLPGSYATLPGVLSSGDEGMLCAAINDVNAVVVLHHEEKEGQLSQISKFLIYFYNIPNLPYENFVALSKQKFNTFLQPSDFLHSVMLRL